METLLQLWTVVGVIVASLFMRKFSKTDSAAQMAQDSWPSRVMVFLVLAAVWPISLFFILGD